MQQKDQAASMVLVAAIVNRGQSNEAVSKLKELGAEGFTACLARGTGANRILWALGLGDSARTLILTVVGEGCQHALVSGLAQHFHMSEPSKGIVFTIPISSLVGMPHLSCDVQGGTDQMEQSAHQLILTIVKRGFAEDVVAASLRGGARGGTIIHARGTGIHEHFTFFGVPIEPEKDIVLTLIDASLRQAVMEEIDKEVELSTPGNGISVALPVGTVLGLVTQKHIDEMERQKE